MPRRFVPADEERFVGTGKGSGLAVIVGWQAISAWHAIFAGGRGLGRHAKTSPVDGWQE